MGQPSKSQPPAYRDDPSMEDAVSLHTTRDDVLDLSAEGEPSTLAIPPPYRDHADGDYPDPHAVTVLQNEYVLPTLDAAKKRKDGTHILISDYANDPAYLEWSVRRWAAVPPAKMVDILGTHIETTRKKDKSEQKKVTDFHIKLRLTEYLFTHPGRSSVMNLKTVENHDSAYRGTILKKVDKRAASDLERTKPTLREWCHRFDASHSKLKMFLLTREVSGLNEIQLEDKLRALVRSTNYKGDICITFPIENPGVEVLSDHWVNRWRNNMAICILFYISMLWIITWPILFFTTKKFAVVKAVWPFSVPDEEGRPQYATMSEAQWFMRWQKAIDKAIIGKVQGVLTEEDLLRAEDPPLTPQTGNSTIDSAAGFLTNGIQAYQAVNRAVGWGYNT